MDSKAGIVIGFAAAVIAFSGSLDSVLADVGRGTAALSAVLAAWAFWPRGFPAIDPSAVRSLYMTAEETLTVRVLTDTEIDRWKEATRLIAEKAWKLKAAIAALALAAVLLFLGILTGA
jgi:hypothetical protein